MKQDRHRAWRFHHPDFDAHDTMPGLAASRSGGIDMVDGAASVRQSLLLLLSTTPGERVMRPDYGCALHELAFAPCDDTTAGLAIHLVRQAIRRFEPRVDIVDLDAARDTEAASRLLITLNYRVRPYLTRHNLRLPLELMDVEND